MIDTNWDKTIEHAAAWLYRDQHGWDRDHYWTDLPEVEQRAYLKQARMIADMYSFPYAMRVLGQLDRLCPCDPNPETTEGPLRECPIHGEQPDAVIAIAQAVRIAEVAEGLFPTHGGQVNLDGSHWEYVDHVALEGLRAALRLRGLRSDDDPTGVDR